VRLVDDEREEEEAACPFRFFFPVEVLAGWVVTSTTADWLRLLLLFIPVMELRQRVEELLVSRVPSPFASSKAGEEDMGRIAKEECDRRSEAEAEVTGRSAFPRSFFFLSFSPSFFSVWVVRVVEWVPSLRLRPSWGGRRGVGMLVPVVLVFRSRMDAVAVVLVEVDGTFEEAFRGGS